MWPFNRKRSFADSGLFDGFTDWHAHILPGVDDGVRTMDCALEILGMYERLGIGSVWLTPHIMEDMPNTTSHLRECFSELRAAWHGSVKLHLSAENMLDNLFEERLAAGDLLPIGEKGDHLLVETSYFNPPIDLYGALDRIKSKGYYPVLAHPERYMYMSEQDYRCLKGEGVKFQLNIGSLAGMYGSAVKAKAEWLVRSGSYDVSGTDIHRVEQMAVYRNGRIRNEILAKFAHLRNF